MLDIATVAASTLLLLFTAYLIARTHPPKEDRKRAIKRDFAELRKESTDPRFLAALDEAEQEELTLHAEKG